MPIPLEVKLFLGTGTLLGEDIPLSTFISQSSVWEQILRDTVDCDQTALKTVPGHKFGYLKSFQPGDTYTFNVNVDPSFTDFDGTKIEPIDVFLIDTNLQSLAIDFAIALAADIGVANISSVIPDFIGYAKDRGWVKRLPTTGGSFTITPSNSDRFIHFSANTSTSTEGCVITDFNSVNNTFLLGGY